MLLSPGEHGAGKRRVEKPWHAARHRAVPTILPPLSPGCSHFKADLNGSRASQLPCLLGLLNEETNEKVKEGIELGQHIYLLDFLLDGQLS